MSSQLRNVYAFLLLSACRRGSYGFAYPNTQRDTSCIAPVSCAHIILYLDAAFSPNSLFSGAFLQAQLDSRNLHFRISILGHFLIFAWFSILLSHAQWTSMQHSCIHISIHCYGPSIYSSIYVPRWDWPQKRLWGRKYMGIREGEQRNRTTTERERRSCK